MIRRLLGLVLLTALFSAHAFAQDPTITATLSSTTCPGTGCVSLSALNNRSMATVEVSGGAWTGALLVEISSSSQSVPVFAAGSKTQAESITANGVYQVPMAGASAIRVRASVLSLGTPAVKLSAGQGSADFTLPVGAATAAKQDTGNASVASIDRAGHRQCFDCFDRRKDHGGRYRSRCRLFFGAAFWSCDVGFADFRQCQPLVYRRQDSSARPSGDGCQRSRGYRIESRRSAGLWNGHSECRNGHIRRQRIEFASADGRRHGSHALCVKWKGHGSRYRRGRRCQFCVAGWRLHEREAASVRHGRRSFDGRPDGPGTSQYDAFAR
jgi:hypothetical protein